jgi:hypothetical protein
MANGLADADLRNVRLLGSCLNLSPRYRSVRPADDELRASVTLETLHQVMERVLSY